MIDNFGNRLELFLDLVYSHIRKKDLATILNIDPVSLSRYINNKVQPKGDFLKSLANLGISINWLLSSEGAVFSNDNNGLDARNKFISFLNSSQNRIIEDYSISNEEIQDAIIEEYNSYDSFVEYLKQFHLKIDSKIIHNYFDSAKGISPTIEDILRKVYFYYLLKYEGKDKECMKYLIDNILQYQETTTAEMTNHCEFIRQVKELIDNHLGN